MTFTFKKNIATGPYCSFEREYSDIKLKGREVGTLNRGAGFGDWSASFRVKSDDPKYAACGWKWITLKVKRQTEKELRDFLNENFDVIVAKGLAQD